MIQRSMSVNGVAIVTVGRNDCRIHDTMKKKTKKKT